MRTWIVELADGRGVERWQAESIRFEGGVVIFSNGDIFNGQFVAAYGPGSYGNVYWLDESAGADD